MAIRLPYLGHGVGLRPTHYPAILDEGRRADWFEVAGGHSELESGCVDVTDALVHGVLVAGVDTGLDRGAGEVAGVGQLGGQVRGHHVEVVDLAVASQLGEQGVVADYAVGGQRLVDLRDQVDQAADLVEEVLVEGEPAGVLQLHHALQHVGEGVR